jgi:hypothetical protein
VRAYVNQLKFMPLPSVPLFQRRREVVVTFYFQKSAMNRNYYSIAVDQQMFESFWYAVGHLHPRERWHMDLMELRDPIGPGDLWLRLRFLEEHGVDQLALGKRLSSQVERQVTDLVSANHSRLGTVLEQLLQIDGIRVDLLPGEWIDLSFPAPPEPGEGFVRSFILVPSGHYQTIP